jgi:hypothetical protein
MTQCGSLFPVALLYGAEELRASAAGDARDRGLESANFQFSRDTISRIIETRYVP